MLIAERNRARGVRAWFEVPLRVGQVDLLGGGPAPGSNVLPCLSAQNLLLDERNPILLVIDDVRSEDQLRPFRIGGRSGKPGAFDPARPADRDRAVATTVNASLNLLRPGDRRIYFVNGQP
jgi:hypothetical protein